MIITNKTLPWVAVLAFSAVAVAGPKTYNVVLDRSVTAGAIQLQPGEYGVKVEGSNAVFTDQERREFTVPVKVENADKKYDATAVETVKQGNADKITGIELGGSKTKLEFGQ